MDLPADKGAYLLLIELAAPLEVPLPGRPAATLPPGRYVYAGSAYGPGGLRARIGRHLRRDKPRRWHVDRLTAAGVVVAVVAAPGGSECALLERVLAAEGSALPLPGFGSSDCRRCPAHLARIAPGFDPHCLPGTLATGPE